MVNEGSVRYLRSKQPVDDRALNRPVLATLQALLQADRGGAQRPRVLELGAGVGTMVSRLADWNVLHRAEYTLIDRDAESLAAARQHLDSWGAGSSGGGARPRRGDGSLMISGGGETDLAVELVQAELFAFLDAPDRKRCYDAVFANAVLDLMDLEPTLPRIWGALRPGGAFWFTINFDGETLFVPEHPLDERVMRLYHGTMGPDPAGTRAGHSQTGRRLLRALPASGASLHAAGSSDWVVFPRNGRYPNDESYFLSHIVDTIRVALERHPDLDSADLTAWVHARRDQIERAELVYIAHQLDVCGRAP